MLRLKPWLAGAGLLALAFCCAQQRLPLVGVGGSSGPSNKLVFIQACSTLLVVAGNSTTLNIGSTGPCGAAVNPTAGDFVMVYFDSGTSNPTGLAASDGLGNSWTCATQISMGGWCYSVLATGGADTATLSTYYSTVGPRISLEFRGQNSSPINVAAAFNTISSSTSYSMPGVTTGNANDVVIGCAGQLNGNYSFTAGSPFAIPTDGTIVGTGSQLMSGMCEYDIVTSTGTYTPTATISTATAGQGFSVALKSS